MTGGDIVMTALAEVGRLRVALAAALEEQRRAVARLAEVTAERDRLLAAVVAQAEAAATWSTAEENSDAEDHAEGVWNAATIATEALGRELRGQR